ncbi:hypothetical protein [Micromonospora sp. NPDC005413]|uniref:hypothetical protein n=1 Tax=Micromonospora sp. NPDC005413 TaxID=3154563 RepID=UPI0033A07E59
MSRIASGGRCPGDRDEPERASCFTDDAIFQGLRPYTVGRAGVAAYYAAQPLGLTATYDIRETRRLADELSGGRLRLYRPADAHRPFRRDRAACQ